MIAWKVGDVFRYTPKDGRTFGLHAAPTILSVIKDEVDGRFLCTPTSPLLQWNFWPAADEMSLPRPRRTGDKPRTRARRPVQEDVS